MERDTPKLLFDEGNKFINVRTKVKNPKLGNEAAWWEAQGLFESSIDGYPEKYSPYLGLVREVFDLRRDAFLRKLPSTDASEKIQALFETLDHNTQELLTGLMVSIRDFFDIPAPSRRLRSG